MKKPFYSSFLLTALLSMVGIPVLAYDIAVENEDGITIYYSWTNNHTELAVSRGIFFISEENNGNLVIPDSVTYQETTYPVTSIDRMAFYKPSWNNLLDYQPLDNIEAAADMIEHHIKLGNKIYIVVDCD
jgi:hypothetical protein